MGVHSLVSDSHLTDSDTIRMLHAAGITTLRYPGGRIADTFHWSTYKPSNWQGLDHPNVGYAPASDLGSFLRFMEQVGTAVFTVNYGSNLLGSGGGEPAEAAAWVAYTNGSPTDTKSIGKDSVGNDWQTPAPRPATLRTGARVTGPCRRGTVHVAASRAPPALLNDPRLPACRFFHPGQRCLRRRRTA